MESLSQKSEISVQRLFRLEKCGRYDEALQMLSGIWRDKSVLPDVDGLDNFEAAELLLRCGSLIGFLGHNKQIPVFQEHSRKVLTKARERFIDIYNEEKIAECENYLAMIYTRRGEISDAQVWVDSAFSHNLPKSNYTRLYTHLVQSIITNADGDHKGTIKNLKPVESDFKEFGDHYLNGAVSVNLGIAHKELNKLSNSIKYFESAKYYHKKSRHKICLGKVENNIATLYNLLEDYSKAHIAIDNAIKVFKELKDENMYAFAYDLKAQIYLEEGKLDVALDLINEAVKILEKSESIDYLVETLSTKTKVLVKLNKIAEATMCISRAIELARGKISEDKSNQLANDFECSLNDTKAPVITQIYKEKEFKNENIELVLPSEISHFEEIEGVWIRNKNLENIGLKKGSLAIIVKEEVERGDLIAVLEKDSEEVICGFYDMDFGIICLEIADQKPQLFDENEVRLLGKIVGVAVKRKDDDNRMYVETIIID